MQEDTAVSATTAPRPRKKIAIDDNQRIVIKGAREHNLKNVDLTLPRNKLIVMTGLSGSGKSSLAFDTIYADGPAPVYGKPFELCPAVSGPDGKAGC